MLSFSDIYQYVLSDRAIISYENIPLEKQAAYQHKIEHLIKKKFKNVSNWTKHDGFRILLRSLPNTNLEQLLYGNVTDEITIPSNTRPLLAFPLDELIGNQFDLLNSTYCYFRSTVQKKKRRDFILFFKVYSLLFHYVNPSYGEYTDDIYLASYKLLVLFGVDNQSNLFARIDRFINQFTKATNAPTLRKLLSFNLPHYECQFDVNTWKKIILRHGYKALQLLHLAPKIRQQLSHDPSSLADIISAAAMLTYQRASSYPDLARLCYTHNVNEDYFNKCLDVVESKRKHDDHLPNITIDGSETNYPGYYLTKLPINDPVIYLLGHLTNCCIKLGDSAEQCIVDAVQNENCGFYVLLKAKRSSTKAKLLLANKQIDYANFNLVGCGYAWLTKLQNLTFDSWENSHPKEDDPATVALLKLFCEVLDRETTIHRVTIGKGGKTPKTLSTASNTYSEIILEGVQHPDSYRQALLYASPHHNSINDNKIEFLREIETHAHLTENERSVLRGLADIDIPTEKYLSWLKKLFLQCDVSLSWDSIFQYEEMK